MTSFSPDQALLQDDSSKPSPKRPKIEGSKCYAVLCVCVEGGISYECTLIKHSHLTVCVMLYSLCVCKGGSESVMNIL